MQPSPAFFLRRRKKSFLDISMRPMACWKKQAFELSTVLNKYAASRAFQDLCLLTHDCGSGFLQTGELIYKNLQLSTLEVKMLFIKINITYVVYILLTTVTAYWFWPNAVAFHLHGHFTSIVISVGETWNIDLISYLLKSKSLYFMHFSIHTQNMTIM